ncbi:MAG: NAD(P)/FAD-dependent oxidoreductase [Actinomycetota bacterium]|nr:NAD(P)/FAD-dependent oxidoreductase [Actinomycetota bacterium]
MSERFDAIVLGAGPGGEAAVNALLRGGATVAMVERELIGGECSHWACVPTKTLLRPPEVLGEARRAPGVGEPRLDFAPLAAYRDYMVSYYDDAKQIAGYEQRGVTVVKGEGRLDGPGRVRVGDRVLESENVVVATGTDAFIPPLEGLEEAGYWTNREATSLNEIPASAIVVGGGPVGIELAQFLSRFGCAVTIVHKPDRLVEREDPHLCGLLHRQLEEDGIGVRTGTTAVAVRRDGAGRVVTLDTGDELSGEALIVAVGRRPRTKAIGLESVGIEVGPRGIAVDERLRAGDGVYAIGDVNGVMPFTHVAKYQARIAAANILGGHAKADYRAIPRVVFTNPEIAAVGLTEANAREHGLDVTTAVVDLPRSIARPYTYEENPRGTLGIVADPARGVLVGAWAMAPLASEWIHQAGLAIRAEVPLEVLRDTVAQFPSYSEGYLSALRALPNSDLGEDPCMVKATAEVAA